MKRIRHPLLILTAVAALLGAAAWLYETSPTVELARAVERGRAASPDASAVRALPTLTVEALAVRRAPAQARIDLAGELTAARSVAIGAEVAGTVVAVEVEENTTVEKGRVLVRLDPQLPRATLARAQAALESAEARATLAAAELARRQELAGQGVVSAAELDRVASEARATRAAVAEARAALLDARTRLEKTRIRAPFAGVVGHLDLEPGAYLRMGDRVAELSDLSEIEIEVGLSDGQIGAVRAGDPALVEVDAFPGVWREARVLPPGRSADPITRKYAVPVRLPNPERQLLPGMLATVRFVLESPRQALRIPRNAVLREFELEYVFVLEAQDDRSIARRRRIRTRPVPFRPELLEVSEGLAEGEQIAISGLRELRDGRPVRLRSPAGAEEALAVGGAPS